MKSVKLNKKILKGVKFIGSLRFSTVKGRALMFFNPVKTTAYLEISLKLCSQYSLLQLSQLITLNLKNYRDRAITTIINSFLLLGFIGMGIDAQNKKLK